MSWQPGQPPPNDPAHFSTPQEQERQQPKVQPPPTPEEETQKVLEELLGGELPGEGYLFPHDPAKRQKNQISTTPEVVRQVLLRTIEVMAIQMQLPLGMEKKGELGKSILELTQGYLLLDPSVDENGVPVEGPGSPSHAQAAATAAFPPPVTTGGTGGQTFKRTVDASGHVEPPKVQPNPAEKAVAEKNKPKSEVLQGARADKPLPKPRVGS